MCVNPQLEPPLLLKGGGGVGIPKIDSLGGGTKNLARKGGITLKKEGGVDVEIGVRGGVGTFYYFTVQLHLLCVCVCVHVHVCVCVCVCVCE